MRIHIPAFIMYMYMVYLLKAAESENGPRIASRFGKSYIKAVTMAAAAYGWLSVACVFVSKGDRLIGAARHTAISRTQTIVVTQFLAAKSHTSAERRETTALLGQSLRRQACMMMCAALRTRASRMDA